MTPRTKANIEQTITALGKLTAAQLRAKYAEVFGEPTRSGNKPYLFKKIAWRLQSLAEGGLSERARRRAQELARDADIRTTVPRPPAALPGVDSAATTFTLPIAKTTAHDRLPIPGTILTRKYRGLQVAVKVLPSGFEYQQQVYRSLSAVAKAITGSHWNGHLFFGLTTSQRKAS